MDKKNLALLLILLTVFIDLLGFGIVIPILPVYVKDISQSDFWVGFIAASYSIMQFIFAPIWGSSSDRNGRRPIILYSLGITIIGYLIFANAASLFVIIIARLVSGIGSANISTAQAYISDISKKEEKVKNMGYIGVAFGLGFIFGPPIGGYLMESFGIEGVGYFTASLTSLNLLLALVFLPESLGKKNTERPSLVDTFKLLAKNFKRPLIKDVLLVYFIMVSAFSMMQITAALLWKEHYFLSEKQIGNVFGFIGICAALFQGLLVGYLSRKWGEKSMFFKGTLFMALGLLMLPFVPLEWFIPLELLALMMIAFANSLLMPSGSALLSNAAGDLEQGQVLGSMQATASLSRGIGPLLGGILYGINYHVPYIVGFLLMILTSILVYRNILKKRSVTI